MSKEIKQFDNLSLTGYRVIALLKMLKEGPHSEAEINEKFKQDIIVSRAISRDSIWLYINTLKALGCQITRPSKKNNYKYILKDHPFKLNLTYSEINSIIQAKKYIANLSNWQATSNFDKFINTISEFVEDETKKILLYSCKNASREIDYTLKLDVINELEFHCDKKHFILVNYKSPSSQNKDIKILCDYIRYENGALYLWGYNTDMEETQYLRVDRIESFRKLEIDEIPYKKQPPRVVYRLTGLLSLSYQPQENEKIIERNNESITIETIMYSRFKMIQKILSFGNECEVLEPEELKKDMYKKLKMMSKIYKD